MVSTQTRTNPFPGLRPFEPDEDHLFFGREGQTDELLRRLKRTRFLAIVGTSGSGKSSLVRAGLLPALYSGFMTRAGSSWRVAVLRPGNDPIANLAVALNQPEALGGEDTDRLHSVITDSTLRRGALGLVEVVQQARMPADENLLIVVDQFEELFRFKQSGQGAGREGDEAAAFVKLLLEATQHPDVPIYAVLTMRSDFLGDCAQFRDLPEAINDSQYLIPRLTREQQRQAIASPVAVGQAEIAPRLVNRLLNDVGDNPDQLPILQHALMRTWDNWTSDHAAGEPIDLRHYEAIGGMERALSQHADEIYQPLDSRDQRIAEKLFKCLTEKASDGRGIRRPMRLGDICAVAGATTAEVIEVVEEFRKPGRSFLMPPVGVALHEDTVLDISHESLMRVWQQLKDWVEEEGQSAQIYRRLAETATMQQAGRAGLYHDPELTIALNWRDQTQFNAAWAKRYNPAFDQAMQFLEDSVAARDAAVAEKEAARQKELNRLRGFSAIVALLFLMALGTAVFAFQQRDRANRRERDAEITAQSFASGNFLASNRDLEALVTGVKVGQRVSELGDRLNADTRTRAVAALRQVVYTVKEQNRLQGHSESVYSVSFSPDGETIASAGNGGTVQLWNRDGENLTTLEGHSGSVYSVSFSPDGETIASADDGGTVRLWNQAGENLATLEGHSGFVWALSFSPDGETIAAAGYDGKVRLWSRTGETLATLEGHSGSVWSVSFSPDGETIASAGEDGTVRLWSRTGETLATLEGHGGSVYSVIFSPDGETIASAGKDGTVRLWNRDGETVTTLEGHTGFVWSVSFSPDGETIASAGEDGMVRLWNRDGENLTTLKGHGGRVRSVSFSPDGERFASAGDDGAVRLWKRDGETLVTLQEHSGSVWSVSFSPDGERFASAGADGSVRLWNRDGGIVATLEGHSGIVWSVSFSPDGERIASADADGTVRLWSRTGETLATLEGHSKRIWSLSFSPDGETLASASDDGTVRLWNRDGGIVTTLEGHSGSVYNVSFSPDGETLASADDSGTVRLWNRDGEIVTTLEGHSGWVSSVSFSPDGETIASASEDGTARLWNRDGEHLATLQGHSGSVRGVSFSPDGETLASAGWDGTVRLWNRAGENLATLEGHSGWVRSVSFSPDGKMLASAGKDGTVRLWNLDLDDLLARGCSWLGDYLKTNPRVSEEERRICEAGEQGSDGVLGWVAGVWERMRDEGGDRHHSLLS